MSKIVAHKDVLPPCSVLNVTIKEARNLAAKDRGGTSDPYCIITLGGKNQVKTKYIEKTLNPVWNEKFNFVATRQSEYLHVVVKDKNRITKDVFLGQVSFPVSDFYEKQSVDRWCPLLKRTTKCKISGDIHILVSLRIPNVDWTVKEVSDLSGAARKPSMVRQVTKTSGSGRSSSLSSLLKSDADENKDKDNKGKDKTDKGKDKGKDKSTGSLVASKGKGKVTEKEDDSAKEKEKEKEKVKAEDTAETEEEKARKAEERRKRKEQRRKERAERRRLQEERERKEQEEFERQERLALLEQEITDVQQIYDVPQTCVKKMKWEPVTRHLSLLLFSNDQRIVTLKIHIPKDYPEDRPQITLEGALGNFKPGIVEAFVKYGNEYASDRFKALADILNFFISNFDKKFNSGRMLHLSAETGTKDLTRSAWLTASMQIGASFRPEQDEEDLEAVIDEEDTENWEETPCFLVRDGANALELHVYQVQAMFGAKSVALVREANEVTLFLDTGYLDSTMADALAIDTSKPICVTLTFDPSYIFSDELPKVRVEQQGSSFFPLAAQLRDIMRVFLRKCWPLRMDDQQSLIEKLKCRTGTEPEIEALREQDKNFLKETYVIPDVDSQSTPSSSSGSSSASSSSPPISATNTPTPPPPPPVSTVSKSATTQVPIPAPPVSISLSSTPTTRTNAQLATGAIHKKTWSDDSSDSDTDSGWPSDESSTDSEVEPESESTTSSEADREEDEETKQRKETAQTLTQLGDFPLPLCIHALKQCRDD
ncbi:phosphatidylserine decarboxylase, partial [Balamuthia mandrillaris]